MGLWGFNPARGKSGDHGLHVEVETRQRQLIEEYFYLMNHIRYKKETQKFLN